MRTCIARIDCLFICCLLMVGLTLLPSLGWAALSAPTNLTATPVSGTKQQITWTPSPGSTTSLITLTKGAQTYRFRSFGSSLTPNFPSTGTWTVSIQGRNSMDLSPATSIDINVSLNAPSSAPTGIVVENQDQRVNLRWTASPSNEFMRITWVDPVTLLSQEIVTKGTYAAIRSLQNNQTYNFTMAWQNATGTGPSTQVTGNPVNLLIQDPISPTATALSVNSTYLNWPAIPGATYYVTYYGPSDSYAVLKATTKPRVTTAPNITLTGVQPNWYAFVLAGNSNGLGPANSTATPLPIIDTPQQAPSVTVTPQPQSLLVSWTSVPGATSYTVRYMPVPYSQALATALSNLTSPYTITGLTNGTTYGVTVTGDNSSGSGPASSPVNGTPQSFAGMLALAASAPPAGFSPYGTQAVELLDGRILFIDYAGKTALWDRNANTWTSAPDLPQPLSSGQRPLIRLSDGRVLALINQYASNPPGAYLFTPSTNAWGSVNYGAEGNNLLNDASAVLLANGNVLLSGGTYNSNSRDGVFLFTTSTSTVSSVSASLPEFRSGGSSTLLANGQVLFSGGINVQNGFWETSSLLTFLFNPGTTSWFSTGSLDDPYWSGQHTALLSDGTALFGRGKRHLTQTTTATGSEYRYKNCAGYTWDDLDAFNSNTVTPAYENCWNAYRNDPQVVSFSFQIQPTASPGNESSNNYQVKTWVQYSYETTETDLDGTFTQGTRLFNPGSGTWAAGPVLPTSSPDDQGIQSNFVTLLNGDVLTLIDQNYHATRGTFNKSAFATVQPSQPWTVIDNGITHSPYFCDYDPGTNSCLSSHDYGSRVLSLSTGAVLVYGGGNTAAVFQ